MPINESSIADARPHPGAVPARYVEPSYLAIWVYLAILTGLELIVYSAPLLKALAIGLLIGLAFAKAALIAMYFMHLRFERRTLALLALSPVIVVLVMVTGSIPDASTRIYARHQAGEVSWIEHSLAREIAGVNPNAPGRR